MEFRRRWMRCLVAAACLGLAGCPGPISDQQAVSQADRIVKQIEDGKEVTVEGLIHDASGQGGSSRRDHICASLQKIAGELEKKKSSATTQAVKDKIQELINAIKKYCR
ncbi:MAG: hypothetical protein HYY93_15680 [Planctomycetes bacterium]|nr:hypothetical protein [Planctomycetota bacterium]